MNDWIVGPTVSIADLSEQDAIAILGRPVYEAWKATRNRPLRGSYRVVRVDRETGTVTLSYEGDT